MKGILVAAALLGIVLVGCDGGGAKSSNPTLAKDAKIDPRLKPATAGGSGTEAAPVTEK